jgi:hypothetical protein
MHHVALVETTFVYCRRSRGGVFRGRFALAGEFGMGCGGPGRYLHTGDWLDKKLLERVISSFHPQLGSGVRIPATPLVKPSAQALAALGAGRNGF